MILLRQLMLLIAVSVFVHGSATRIGNLSSTPSAYQSASVSRSVSWSLSSQQSPSLTSSATPTFSLSPSMMPSPSFSRSLSPFKSVSPTLSDSSSVFPSPSVSHSASPVRSSSPTMTSSETPQSTASLRSGTVTETMTDSVTLSSDATQTKSPSRSAPSNTPSATGLASVTVSGSPDLSTKTLSLSVFATITDTRPPTSTVTVTVTETNTSSPPPTITGLSSTQSGTKYHTLSSSETSTVSSSRGSVSRENSDSESPSQSRSSTSSEELDATRSPSRRTRSGSLNHTRTQLRPHTASESNSITVTFSPETTETRSVTPTITPPPTPTRTLVPSASATVNGLSMTVSLTNPQVTTTVTLSFVISATRTMTAGSTTTRSRTPTITPPPTPSATSLQSVSKLTPTLSIMSTRSCSASLQFSATRTITPPPTPTVTSSPSLVASGTWTTTPTVTPPPTPTLSFSPSRQWTHSLSRSQGTLSSDRTHSLNSATMSHEATQFMTNQSFVLRLSGSQWASALATDRTAVLRGVTSALSAAIDVPQWQIGIHQMSVGSLVVAFSLNQYDVRFQNFSTLNQRFIVANYTVLEALLLSLTGQRDTVNFLAIVSTDASPMPRPSQSCDSLCLRVVLGSVLAAAVCVVVGIVVWRRFDIWKEYRESGRSLCGWLCPPQSRNSSHRRAPATHESDGNGNGTQWWGIGFVPDSPGAPVVIRHAHSQREVAAPNIAHQRSVSIPVYDVPDTPAPRNTNNSNKAVHLSLSTASSPSGGMVAPFQSGEPFPWFDAGSSPSGRGISVGSNSNFETVDIIDIATPRSETE